MPYVYLIEDSEIGLYKIGVTKSSIQNRLKKLLTGNPSNLYIVDYFETEYPYKIEKMMHNCHQLKRYKNEWFMLTKDDILNFKNDCNKYQKIIESLLDNPYMHAK